VIEISIIAAYHKDAFAEYADDAFNIVLENDDESGED